MGTSYIPKDVYTICTFQQDAEPRQLIPTRSSITVFYGADRTRPLLTVEDRNINREFPCKSPKNAMWSFLCFGAGLLAGIALLSNPIGWAVALGIGVAALSIAAGVYEATQIKHKCSGSLGAGNWKIQHDSVRFDTYKSITHNSMLLCDAGGILTPIFSYSVARKNAALIKSNNNKEIFVNAAASFFGGAGAVISVAEMGFIATAKWAAATMAFMHIGTTAEKEIIRSTAMEENLHYQNMNEQVDPNSLIPGYIKDPTATTPGDLSSPDIFNVGRDGVSAPYFINPFWYIRDIKGNIIQIQQGTQLAKDLNALKNIDSRKIWQTAEGKQIVENIRSGKYPSSMVSASRDGTGTVRPRNLPLLEKALPEVKKQNIRNIGQAGVKGSGFIAFVFPFVATYFSEKSRQILANAMAEDADNGVKIIAVDAP